MDANREPIPLTSPLALRLARYAGRPLAVGPAPAGPVDARPAAGEPDAALPVPDGAPRAQPVSVFRQVTGRDGRSFLREVEILSALLVADEPAVTERADDAAVPLPSVEPASGPEAAKALRFALALARHADPGAGDAPAIEA